MHLAVLHYHLNRGGVTQVIQNHLRALALQQECKVERVAILHGGRCNGWPANLFQDSPPFDLDLLEVPALEYDDVPQARPEKLAHNLSDVLTEAGFAAKNALLHVHNHALGKNASLPGALGLLARDGYRQLLQVHDFAEDFRPANYAHLATALAGCSPADMADQLYPQAGGIHYATLNRRDRAVLARAGIPDGQLHLLVNPVAEFGDLPGRDDARLAVATELGLAADELLFVYPVRGIRRKNLGEMLLLSALDDRRAVYAVTLAPLNPTEAASFTRWHAVSAELGLPCRFDIGAAGRLPFEHVVAAADWLLTTSVAEGFGMVYLEAWLAGRPLAGRNLPEITSDFVDHGLQLPHLYDQIRVPMHLVSAEAARDDLATAYRAACAAYGQPGESPDTLEKHLDELMSDDAIDFARLGSKLQQTLIESAARQETIRVALLAANPKLAKWIRDTRVGDVAPTIRANAAVVRDSYSLASAGRRLAEIYQAVWNCRAGGPAGGLPRGELILESFLDLQRLHPVRLETCRPTNRASGA